MNEFHYLLLNKFQFLKNNAIEEILRERAHYYLSENKIRDFWVIESPDFVYKKDFMEKMKESQFYKNNKNLNQMNQFYAIVSSDKIFINWLALRIGYFENLNEKKVELNTKSYTSTGLCGKFKAREINSLISLPLTSKVLKLA